MESRVPPLAVGWTPLYDAPRIAASLGLERVWVKDDGANPTGSLKDRASALVLARALEAGIDIVSAASTGNAAAALAGLGASLPEIEYGHLCAGDGAGGESGATAGLRRARATGRRQL